MAGGSSVPPTAPEERNRTAAAPCNQYATPGLSGAPELAATKARSALQREERSTPLLQSALEDTRLQCWLIVHTRESERHSHGACLRRVFVAFFGKTKISHEQCLTSAATRPTLERDATRARRVGCARHRTARQHVPCAVGTSCNPWRSRATAPHSPLT